MSVLFDRTASGTRFRSYDEVIEGDGVRAYIPLEVSNGPSALVVWFIHAYGSSHDALVGGYNAQAEAVVNAGGIAICPNLGGSLWSSPKAQELLMMHNTALIDRLASSGISVGRQVMVGTSHGGCISTYATGKSLIGKIRGLYLINGVYDIESNGGSADSRESVRKAFDYSGPAQAAGNPARISVEKFVVPIRLVYSTPDSSDRVVPPELHSKAFIRKLKANGNRHSVRTHRSGHHTPGGTPSDLMSFIRSL